MIDAEKLKKECQLHIARGTIMAMEPKVILELLGEDPNSYTFQSEEPEYPNNSVLSPRKHINRGN